MLKTAQEVVASGDVPSIVDFGIELERTMREELVQLEEIKEVLRQLGKRQLGDRRTAAERLIAKTVQLSGNLGDVSVTYPGESPKLKPGVDIAASEAGLPSGVFELLFKKRTVIDMAEDFMKKLGTLEPEDRKLIVGLIELQAATARVTWPK